MGPNLFNDSSSQQPHPYLTAILEEDKQPSEAVVLITMDPFEIVLTKLCMSDRCMSKRKLHV